MATEGRVLYTCPCGLQVHACYETEILNRHPQCHQIEADIIAGMSNSEVAKKYNLTRSGVAGRRDRLWKRIQLLSDQGRTSQCGCASTNEDKTTTGTTSP